VTVHHLMLTKDDATSAYEKCMPIIKTANDRTALRRAVTSGDARFFLGTDSAPHTVAAKESDNPPAGIFTAPAAIELYAQVFDEEGKLENLEKFASLNGPKFYGMEPNEETMTLEKNPWTIDPLVELSDGSQVHPFGYHEDPAKRLQIQWRLS
jgi:dihydroorotase